MAVSKKKYYERKREYKHAHCIDMVTFIIFCFIVCNSMTCVDDFTIGNEVLREEDSDESECGTENEYLSNCGEIYDEIQEYQQCQVTHTLHIESDDDTNESSEEGVAANDEGGGNLDGYSDDEWKALIGDVSMCSVGEFAHRSFYENNDGKDMHCGQKSDSEDIESVASSFKVSRHPRDPTYADGEDTFEDTEVIPTGEMTKSRVGIKHSRSQSVLLHCDAEKLLHVIRGLRSHVDVDEACVTNLRTEYVEEAGIIHGDVFDELWRVFPNVLQLQRLLMLPDVKSWCGWKEIKSLLEGCECHVMKQFHVDDFVYRFARRCQSNCVYEDFPTDEERKQHLQDDGYTIGRATGHRCNSLIDSLLQSL